jgi:hypothetical protein
MTAIRDCSGKCVIREVKYVMSHKLSGPTKQGKFGKNPNNVTPADTPSSDEIDKDLEETIHRFFHGHFKDQCSEPCYCSLIVQEAPSWTKWGELKDFDAMSPLSVEKNAFVWLYTAKLSFASRAWAGICVPSVTKDGKKKLLGKEPHSYIRRSTDAEREKDIQEEKKGKNNLPDEPRGD